MQSCTVTVLNRRMSAGVVLDAEVVTRALSRICADSQWPIWNEKKSKSLQIDPKKNSVCIFVLSECGEI